MEASTDKRGRPRVVATGMGLITPCGTGLDKSWSALNRAYDLDERLGDGVTDAEASFGAAARDEPAAGIDDGYLPTLGVASRFRAVATYRRRLSSIVLS